MADDLTRVNAAVADELEAGLDELADVLVSRALGDSVAPDRVRLPPDARAAVRAAARAILADAAKRLRDGGGGREALPPEVTQLARLWAGNEMGMAWQRSRRLMPSGVSFSGKG